jgi:hypothetical protein
MDWLKNESLDGFRNTGTFFASLVNLDQFHPNCELAKYVLRLLSHHKSFCLSRHVDEARIGVDWFLFDRSFCSYTEFTGRVCFGE